MKSLSLRERKKVETRRELAQSAYEVIRDHGVDALTADSVTQRAGVSRRTFFNYFPTVEASIVPVVEEFLDDIITRLPDHIEQGRLAAGLATTLREIDDPGLLERFTVIALMSHRSLGHQALLYQSVREWTDRFVGELASLAGPDVDELWLHGIAHALHSAADAALMVWIHRTEGEITPETIALAQSLMADAIDQLGRGFDN